MSKDVSIVISFNTKPAADAMQSLLTVVNQAGGKVEELGEIPVPVPEGLPATKNTIAAIREEILRLEEQLEGADIGSAKFDDLSSRLAKAQIQLSNATNTQTRFAGSSMNARMMLQQFNFGLQDAPMFMTNFRMGLMSVGNNLDMVAQTFMRVREESKETGKSVTSLVTGALKGPTGILIAVSVLIALLQVLPQLFKKTGEEADAAAEQGLKNFADRIREASRVKIAAALAEQITLIAAEQKKLESLRESVVREVKEGPRAGMLQTETRGTPAEIAAQQKIINDMVTVRKILTEAIGEKDKEIGDSLLKQEEAKLQELTKQRNELTAEQVAKGELIKLNQQIEAQEIRLKRLREIGTEAGKPPELPRIEIEDSEDVGVDDIKGKIPRLQDRLAEIDALMKVEESDERIRDLSEERRRIQSEINQLTTEEGDILRETVSEMVRNVQSELAQEASRGFTRSWISAFGEINSVFEVTITSMANMAIQKFTEAAITDLLFLAFGFGNPLGLFASIPAAASGGVVTRPTLAMVGEAGPEAIIPLNRSFAGFLPPPPAPVQVVNHITVEGRIRRGDIYLSNKKVSEIKSRHS